MVKADICKTEFLVSARNLYRYKRQNPENSVVGSSSGEDNFSEYRKLTAIDDRRQMNSK
jgi:hypothetical protein